MEEADSLGGGSGLVNVLHQEFGLFGTDGIYQYILVQTGTDRYRSCLVIFLFSDVGLQCRMTMEMFQALHPETEPGSRLLDVFLDCIICPPG